MNPVPNLSLYQRLGEPTIRRVVHSFYNLVKTDPILGPMYPADDWAGAEERLADFLVFRFGGPDDYLRKRGHPRLRMRHMPFKIDQAAKQRWVDLMSQAMAQNLIPAAERDEMSAFFEQVADFLRNQPE